MPASNTMVITRLLASRFVAEMARVLPLTRLKRWELFVYDIAVKGDWQRKGIDRALFDSLRQAAAAEGIAEGFVLKEAAGVCVGDAVRLWAD